MKRFGFYSRERVYQYKIAINIDGYRAARAASGGTAAQSKNLVWLGLVKKTWRQLWDPQMRV